MTNIREILKRKLPPFFSRTMDVETAKKPFFFSRNLEMENTHLRLVLMGLLADAVNHDLQLDDPRHDGSGTDAEAPTGDDYNELYDLVLDACRAAGIDVKAEIERIKASWMRKSFIDPSVT